MKKSFTLIELIIVIVILGILGTISVEILQNSANSYIKTKELNKLSQKTDLVLNIIASKLQNRIKNSVIAVKCDAQTGTCLNNSNKEFISINSLTSTNANEYPVLEWLYTPIYSKRGMWNGTLKKIQPGWSGFVDLKLTEIGNNDEYNITTPDSNFSIVQVIDGNWSEAWRVSGYNNVFSNEIDTLVFSGSDGRGDFEDVNNSYGYYGNNATRVFKITKINDTKLNIKAITESNSTTVYEGYYLVRGAMAIVPIYNSSTNDYNLTLRFNYFPWKNQMYMDGNSTIIATNITKFKFKEEGGVIRIFLCITSHNVKLSDFNLTICKEKVIF